jgi:hypothetical protein
VAVYRLGTLKLIACGGLLRPFRNNADLLLAIATAHPLKDDITFRGRKDRMILANADILARMEFGPALAHNNVSRDYVFPTKTLNPQAFCLAVATVLR